MAAAKMGMMAPGGTSRPSSQSHVLDVVPRMATSHSELLGRMHGLEDDKGARGLVPEGASGTASCVHSPVMPGTLTAIEQMKPSHNERRKYVY